MRWRAAWSRASASRTRATTCSARFSKRRPSPLRSAGDTLDCNGDSNMYNLGIHALIWVGGWSHDECERAIAQTAELGFDLIEIPALHPASIDAAFTRKMLDRYQLGTTLSLGLDASTDISSADPDTQSRGEARLMQVLAVARDIGATHVCGI